MLVREEMLEILTIMPKKRTCFSYHIYHAAQDHDAAILIMITVLLIRFILLNGPHGNILRAALIPVEWPVVSFGACV